MKKFPNISPSFLEYPIPVLIQSGQSYNVNNFNVNSDENKLSSETVYLNICGKYKDMHAMASRTLLVNPTDAQKNAYIIANETLDVIIKNLKVGETISKAYREGRMYIQNKNPEFANKIHNNFGFGIGSAFKEKLL